MNDFPATARAAAHEYGSVHRAILESTDQGYCTIEMIFGEDGRATDYRFVETNPAFERQSGLVDAVGRRIREFAPDLEEHWFERYGRVALTGEAMRVEDEAAPLGRWFDISAFRVGAPEQRRIAVLFDDITDRKRAEAALQASEARFRGFVNAKSDAIYRMSPDWSQMRQLDGQGFISDTPEPSEDWMDRYILQEDRQSVQKAIDEAIRTKSELDLEHRVIRADGTPGWTRSRAIPILGEQGEITEWLGTASDITQAKGERVALRESEEQFRALFDNMAEGYVLFGVVRGSGGEIIDLIYREANKALEHQAGFDRAKIIGRPFTDIVTPADAERWTAIFEPAIDRGESVTLEEYSETVGRWFSVSVYPHGEDQIAVFYRDISERKRAEETLRENEEQQAFLLKLSDALRAEPSAEAVADRALQMLSAQMGLHRCYIGIFRLEEDRGEFPHQVHDESLPPLPAHVRLSDFSDVLKIASDRTLVIDDIVKMEGISDSDRASLDGLGLGALLVATLRKGENNPLWAIAAASTLPRVWTPGEVSLVEEVAERTWAAVERSRAEAANKRAEARVQQLVSLAELSSEFFGTCDMEFMPTFGNAAAMRLVGLADLDQVKQTPLREFFFPEDQAFITDEFLPRVLREGQGKTEIRFRHFVTSEPVWVVYSVVVLKDEMGHAIGLGTVTHDITERKRTEAILRDSERHQGLLLAELQHRVRNILTMVRSIARRTADNTEDVDDYVRHLDGRLAALARVQAILTRDPGKRVDLHDMVLDELKSQAALPANYQIEGPEVALAPKAAEVLSLAVHELATNSTKYGVLSESSGAIRIRWTVDDRDGQAWLRWTWHEPIDSKIDRPARTGFGTELIRNRVPYELRGTGEMRIGDNEVEVTIDFPLASGESKPLRVAADKDIGQ